MLVAPPSDTDGADPSCCCCCGTGAVVLVLVMRSSLLLFMLMCVTKSAYIQCLYRALGPFLDCDWSTLRSGLADLLLSDWVLLFLLIFKSMIGYFYSSWSADLWLATTILVDLIHGSRYMWTKVILEYYMAYWYAMNQFSSPITILTFWYCHLSWIINDTWLWYMWTKVILEYYIVYWCVVLFVQIFIINKSWINYNIY